MDIEATKTVIFGIGGAGCKIIQKISAEPLNDVGLIALDNDRTLLNSMSGDIERVFVGEAFEKKCERFEDVHNALNEKINSVEHSLDGVGMAIVIVGLGGKTGSCMGGFIGDLCERKNIFTLFIPIFPLKKTSGNLREIEGIIKKLREKSGGVIIIDNNMYRRDGKVPMLQVFERTNNLVITLVKALVDSVCYRSTTNLDRDELMQFFYGDYYFIVGFGEGSSLKNANGRAITAIKAYAEVTAVKKLLVVLSGRPEPSISEMKELNLSLQKELDPEGVKWINMQQGGIGSSVLLVSAVRELPLIEEVSLPDPIESDIINDHKEKIHVDRAKALSSNTDRYTKVEPMDTLTSEDDHSALVNFPEEVVVEQISGGDDAEKNVENKNQIDLGDSSEDDFLDKSMEGLMNFKSPALIGLRRDDKDKKGTGEGGNMPFHSSPGEEEPEEDSEDIDDIVSEISGFPSFKTKKKGQKKLDDYDGWGIDYI